jgi:uncharacterized Zn finger protein (UPF0148 family)
VTYLACPTCGADFFSRTDSGDFLCPFCGGYFFKDKSSENMRSEEKYYDSDPNEEIPLELDFLDWPHDEMVLAQGVYAESTNIEHADNAFVANTPARKVCDMPDETVWGREEDRQSSDVQDEFTVCPSCERREYHKDSAAKGKCMWCGAILTDLRCTSATENIAAHEGPASEAGQEPLEHNSPKNADGIMDLFGWFLLYAIPCALVPFIVGKGVIMSAGSSASLLMVGVIIFGFIALLDQLAKHPYVSLLIVIFFFAGVYAAL